MDHCARFAFLLVPMLDNTAVIQVPMFWPSIIGAAEEKRIAPVDVSA